MSTPRTPRRQDYASALCGDGVKTVIGFGLMEAEDSVQSWLSNVSSLSEMDSSEVSASTIHETTMHLPCDFLQPPNGETVQHPMTLQDTTLGKGTWPRTFVDYETGSWWPAVTHSFVPDGDNQYINKHEIDASLVLPSFKLNTDADSNVKTSTDLAAHALYSRVDSYTGWQRPVPAPIQDAGEFHDCGSHDSNWHCERELLSSPSACRRLASEVQGCQMSSPCGYAVPCLRWYVQSSHSITSGLTQASVFHATDTVRHRVVRKYCLLTYPLALVLIKWQRRQHERSHGT